MSTEIINTFTSNENINYLKDYLSNNIDNEKAKKIVLDTIIEDVFNFPCHALLDDSKQRLRQSSNKWEEIKRLNKEFIENRLSFVKEMDDIGIEAYATQMFYDDSLLPYGYEFLNKEFIDVTEKNKRRLFRYENKHDSNISSIPFWQKTNTPSFDTNNDSLRDSGVSQIRKIDNDYMNANKSSNLNKLSVNNNKHKWIDL